MKEYKQIREEVVQERLKKILGTTIEKHGSLEIQKDYYAGESHIHKNVDGYTGREHVIETRRLKPRIIEPGKGSGERHYK